MLTFINDLPFDVIEYIREPLLILVELHAANIRGSGVCPGVCASGIRCRCEMRWLNILSSWLFLLFFEERAAELLL